MPDPRFDVTTLGEMLLQLSVPPEGGSRTPINSLSILPLQRARCSGMGRIGNISHLKPHRSLTASAQVTRWLPA